MNRKRNNKQSEKTTLQKHEKTIYHMSEGVNGQIYRELHSKEKNHSKCAKDLKRQSPKYTCKKPTGV